MWTRKHREIYKRVGGRYPSDLTDAEWARLVPLIPPGKPGGRPRTTDMRAAMNAILYLLRTSCPWRYLPRDGFPPRSTVYMPPYQGLREPRRDPRGIRCARLYPDRRQATRALVHF